MTLTPLCPGRLRGAPPDLCRCSLLPEPETAGICTASGRGRICYFLSPRRGIAARPGQARVEPCRKVGNIRDVDIAITRQGDDASRIQIRDAERLAAQPLAILEMIVEHFQDRFNLFGARLRGCRVR